VKTLKTYKGLAVSFLIVEILLVNSWNISLSQGSSNGQVDIDLFDEFAYVCSYDFLTGYSEEVSHTLSIFAHNLPNVSNNNLTLILEDENLTRISISSNAIASNFTRGNVQAITLIVDGSECDLHLTFGRSMQRISDPMNLTILPRDLTVFPLNDGHLSFDVELMSTEFFADTNSYIYPGGYPNPVVRQYSIVTDMRSMWNYTDGQDILLSGLNVTEGKHKLKFDIVYDSFRGSFLAAISASIRNSCTLSVNCYLNGEEIFPEKRLLLNYRTKSFEFIESVSPSIYAYSDSMPYSLDFLQVDSNLGFTVDRSSREKVNLLCLDSDIQDFSVQEIIRYDNPCFSINLHTKSITKVTLGLAIYDKIWFLRPEDMRMDDIPKSIKDKYTDPTYSSMGLVSPNLIDKDNLLVKLWSNQIVKNETNPYIIAYLLYKNFSDPKTRTYDENLTGVWMKASEVLENRRGVCAHFAIAYAALCMANDLPIRYIEGTVYVGNGTYKKNHAWNEVFLPKYGWVSVDTTWGIFDQLANSHILYTLWPRTEKLNITNYATHSPQMLEKSKNVLNNILLICYSKLDQTRDKFAHTTSEITEIIERCETNLLEAELLVESLFVHEALLKISNIYLIIDSLNKSDNSPILPSLLIGIIIITIVLILLTKNYTKRIFRRYRNSVRQPQPKQSSIYYLKK